MFEKTCKHEIRVICRFKCLILLFSRKLSCIGRAFIQYLTSNNIYWAWSFIEFWNVTYCCKYSLWSCELTIWHFHDYSSVMGNNLIFNLMLLSSESNWIWLVLTFSFLGLWWACWCLYKITVKKEKTIRLVFWNN